MKLLLLIFTAVTLVFGSLVLAYLPKWKMAIKQLGGEPRATNITDSSNVPETQPPDPEPPTLVNLQTNNQPNTNMNQVTAVIPSSTPATAEEIASIYARIVEKVDAAQKQ